MPSEAWFKTRRRLIGVVMLAVFGLLIWLAIAAYNKQFTPATMVTLDAGTAGNEMNIGAEVMNRGVVIGDVRAISSTGTGARLTLALQPGAAAALPSNVTAMLLPTTLFGQRYVQLSAPPVPSAQILTAGAVIDENHSKDAIELQKVLDDLLPMLTAVQPQKLAVTLSAMATALNGNGARLGQTLDTINSYLKTFTPDLPQLDTDISELATVSQTYAQAAPDIVSALRNFTVTSETVASEASNLQTVYSTVTAASQNLTSFLSQNKSDIIGLSTSSEQTLQTLARYSPEFPCIAQGVKDFIPNINKALGAGTSEPGLRVSLHPVESRGQYVAGKDTPKFGDNLGPQCYSAPFKGITLNDGMSKGTTPTSTTSSVVPTTQDGGQTAVAADVPAAGLGLANSPAENELINELLSPALNIPPDQLPSWTSVLTGPLFRGTEVTIK